MAVSVMSGSIIEGCMYKLVTIVKKKRKIAPNITVTVMFTIDHYAGVPFIIVSRLVDTHILFLWL